MSRRRSYVHPGVFHSQIVSMEINGFLNQSNFPKKLCFGCFTISQKFVDDSQPVLYFILYVTISQPDSLFSLNQPQLQT